MYYIEQEDDKLVKYEVELNRENLERLRQEIIDECGEITHRCYEGVRFPYSADDVYIKNIRETFIGIKEYNDFQSPDEEIFRYEYDEHKEPNLAKLIKQILAGKTTAISELNQTNQEENVVSNIDFLIKSKIVEIESILSKQEKVNTQALEAKTTELKKLQEHKNLNESRKSTSEYYPLVKECIKLQEISKIKKSIVKEVSQFLEDVSTENVDKTCTNKLKRMIK